LRRPTTPLLPHPGLATTPPLFWWWYGLWLPRLAIDIMDRPAYVPGLVPRLPAKKEPDSPPLSLL